MAAATTGAALRGVRRLGGTAIWLVAVVLGLACLALPVVAGSLESAVTV